MFKQVIFVWMVGMLALGCSEHSGQSEKEAAPPAETRTVETPAPLSGPLSATLNAYFAVKDALVRSNETLAAEKAALLQRALAGENYSGLSPEAKKIMEEAAAEIAGSSVLSEQRVAFFTLSEELISVVKSAELNGTVFVQHCPMAFDNEGADWLSQSEKVFNPYFGNMMLHCGYVTETLAQK